MRWTLVVLVLVAGCRNAEREREAREAVITFANASDKVVQVREAGTLATQGELVAALEAEVTATRNLMIVSPVEWRAACEAALRKVGPAPGDGSGPKTVCQAASYGEYVEAKHAYLETVAPR